FIAASLLTTSDDENTGIVFSISKNSLKWAPVFLIFFIMGNDFWAWGRKPVLAAGLPLWVWYYFGLGILLSAAYKLFLKSSDSS
ncbi:unnamed protein product, partial [marine sediment metagenome]